jgi:hypothetical protein
MIVHQVTAWLFEQVEVCCYASSQKLKHATADQIGNSPPATTSKVPDFLKQLLSLVWRVFNKPFPYSMPVEDPLRTVQGKDYEVCRYTHRFSEQDTSPFKIGRVGDNKR